MVCVRLRALKFKAGPSHGLGRGVRPLRSLRGAGRLLGVLGHAGAVAAPASNTFETPTALLVCLMRLIVVLMRLIVVLMRLK